MNPPAVILAAGQSIRMGRDKTSLPWLQGLTLLEWTVQTLIDAGWSPIVVFGEHQQNLWNKGLENARIVINPHADKGRTTSIAAGVATLPAGSKLPLLLTSVDQPRPLALYRRLKESLPIGDQEIVAPAREQRPSHPLVIGHSLIPQLMNLQEERQGLRGLLDDHQDNIRLVDCPNDWVRWNCNTPELYQEALQWFESTQKNLE